jgi:hypothetical protein
MGTEVQLQEEEGKDCKLAAKQSGISIATEFPLSRASSLGPVAVRFSDLSLSDSYFPSLRPERPGDLPVSQCARRVQRR